MTAALECTEVESGMSSCLPGGMKEFSFNLKSRDRLGFAESILITAFHHVMKSIENITRFLWI